MMHELFRRRVNFIRSLCTLKSILAIMSLNVSKSIRNARVGEGGEPVRPFDTRVLR
jgi:hypothetical protein